MIHVQFNDPSEFLTELMDNPPNVDPVLRVTQSWEASKISPSIHHVSVLATYVRRIRANGASLVQLVTLRRYCGDDWGNVGDKRATQRAEEIMKQITELAKTREIDVRAGVYVDGKEVKP